MVCLSKNKRSTPEIKPLTKPSTPELTLRNLSYQQPKQPCNESSQLAIQTNANRTTPAPRNL
ncbi:hypothetical protein M758_12G128100 [Ceratodon purpureus]|uniref:Uncharacterized protein n=1 Tax=Ceratodon purpureus TaxID=3225 RepID=A0A8T0GA55_CERPU|nr:hypothetical protein KC19_12G125600 [Ceratodon purpureus]KAG0599102.1 hypothetical protein M758_12G128100 [Ceratodon purpureus]